MANKMNKRKRAAVEWRESDAGTCEAFGRLDALYHFATGGRLDRSSDSLEIIGRLLCNYGMEAIEEVWGWWMREPDYGRDCRDPLGYFTESSVFDDIYALAIADTARARLAARGRELREAVDGQERGDGVGGSK